MNDFEAGVDWTVYCIETGMSQGLSVEQVIELVRSKK